MSQTYEGGPVAIFAVGKTVTTGAATASTTLPIDSAGNNPRYIRVSATTESYINLGNSSVTATTNNVLIQPADCLIMAVSGTTYIAYIQGTTSGKLNVLALENM